MSGQSKTGSFVEALTNIAVGVTVAFFSQLVIFAYCGVHVSLQTNGLMTLFFTAISLVRSFCLRRFFNWLTVRREIRQEAAEWAQEPRSFLEAANREFEKRLKEKTLNGLE